MPTVALMMLASCGVGPGPAGGAEGSVARIEAEACTGLHMLEATAVAVAPDLLVTVAHTFDETRGFDVLTEAGEPLAAELVFLDPERDLALIRTEEQVAHWLEFGVADEGQVTRLISAADPGDLEVKRAVVLDITNVTLDGVGERQALKLQADIRSGDSGAPVVADDGRLVGLVFAATRSADRGWAITAAEIEPILERTGGVPERSCTRPSE